MKRWQPYLPALTVFCLALLMRLAYNLTVARGYVAGYDSQVYEKIALHLLQERCFCLAPHLPTAGRAPLWPAIIAGLYVLFGSQNFSARLFLCVIGAATCVLVYLWAQAIFGKRTAIAAGIIASLYPGLFLYDGWLYAESLYTFCLLALTYTLYLAQTTARRRWILVSGILLGLLSLTRPNGLIVLILVIFWTVIVAKARLISWRTALESAMLISVLTLGIVSPWTVRNFIVSRGQFIPVATGDGIVLLGAYNDMVLADTPFKGIWIRPSLVDPNLFRAYAACGATCEAQRDTAYKDRAARWVKGHSNTMPYLLSLHLKSMWTPATPEADLPMNQFPERTSAQIVMGMVAYLSIPVFLLAVIGLLLTWRLWRHLLFLYLVLALTIGQCLYFYGSSRFRAPIEPMLVLLATGALWWMAQKFNSRHLIHTTQQHALERPPSGIRRAPASTPSRCSVVMKEPAELLQHNRTS
ncbi:MAG: ArnT family glycosyltransferase [Ktedonobacteraceae bacterium]